MFSFIDVPDIKILSGTFVKIENDQLKTMTRMITRAKNGYNIIVFHSATI